MFISIKPLSVNKARQGKRFKTPEYKKYEAIVLMMLPKVKIDKGIKLQVNIERHFSNKLSDIDNPTKLVLDLMQKKRDFNDSQIYSLNLTKKIVAKWNEWFSLDIWKII